LKSGGESKSTSTGVADDCPEANLAEVNETISTEQEETMDSLFECTNDEDGQYIDLMLNPERYTGSVCGEKIVADHAFVCQKVIEEYLPTGYGSPFTRKTASSGIPSHSPS